MTRKRIFYTILSNIFYNHISIGLTIIINLTSIRLSHLDILKPYTFFVSHGWVEPVISFIWIIISTSLSLLVSDKRQLMHKACNDGTQVSFYLSYLQQRVSFHNTGPSWVCGVIVMSIEDGHDGFPGLSQLDPMYVKKSFVIFSFEDLTSIGFFDKWSWQILLHCGCHQRKSKRSIIY